MVKDNKKIKYLITAYILCMLLSSFIDLASRYNIITLEYSKASDWLDVFWACYKNLTLIGCFLLLIFKNKVSNSDTPFLWFAVMINITQCLLYCLCPITENQITKDIAFGSFVLLSSIGLIVTWGG